MNQQSVGGRRLWKRYIALLLLGMLGGSSCMLFWYGKELENLMQMNNYLSIENERLSEEVENLKQTQRVAKKKQELVIDKINVIVMDPRPHEYIEAKVIRLIEKDLAPLKGKKPEQVEEMQSILFELLYRREYIVEGKMVEVRLKHVVITRNLHVYVTAHMETGDSK